MTAVPLSAQLAEVKRELRMRRGAYPRFIARGTLTPENAATQIAALEAVANTLEELAQSQEAASSPELPF